MTQNIKSKSIYTRNSYYLWTEKDIKNINNKDQDTFTELYKRYSKNVYNFLLIKTKNENLAGDILSDTFYSAWISSFFLKNNKNIIGWLIDIAKKRLCDYLRKEYTRNKYHRNSLIIEIENNPLDILIKNSYNKKQALLINITLDNIFPRYKKIIELKYFEKLSQKEIAKKLNKTIRGVENQLYRARKQLKIEVQKIKIKGLFD